MIRVLIAAESEILRRGLAASVPEDAAIEIVESFDPSSGQLAEKIEELQPDAIIFERRGVEDEILPLLAGREDAYVPGIVLLVESPTGDFVREAIAGGIRAVLSRDASSAEIFAAAEAAAAGLVALDPASFAAALSVRTNGTRGIDGIAVQSLSPREIEVLRMMAEGLGNKEIASRMKLSEHTVKFHISSIFTKLDVSSRTEAVTLGVRLGLVPL
jgi:two-component system, NarL family, response regulator YdfI